MPATARYDYASTRVLVAGASGGLGAAVVRAYVEAGASVVGVARHPEASSPAAESMVCDLQDEAAVAGLFAGRPPFDAVVNLVGGYAAGQPVAELALATLEAQLAVNLRPAFLLTKHALPGMLAAGQGAIVHVGSRAGVETGARAFAYSASKQAVQRLVEATAAETRRSGVRINCVLPSTIDTPVNRTAMPKADHARWPKPEQIARVLLFLTAADASLISGAAIPVYGDA